MKITRLDAPRCVGRENPKLDQLYVTTIAHDVAGEAQGSHSSGVDDQAGSLFVIEDIGVSGRQEPRFAD